MSDPYAELADYLTDVVERGKPIDENVPYWPLLVVAMDRRVLDVDEDRPDESMDTVEVEDAQLGDDRLTLSLRASTFVGKWYPIRFELRRPPEQCVLWFGAPDLAVLRRHKSDMVWPTDDAAWPAIYHFRLDLLS